MSAEFLSPISRDIWEQKYQLKRDGEPVDLTLDDTFMRVARAAASVEKGGARGQKRWALAFHDLMADHAFLPAGRILAGAGWPPRRASSQDRTARW